jgi:hypothetical protein
VGSVNNVNALANILGCGVSSLSFIGSFFKAKSILDCVIEKIERHLVGWKMMYLSKGERITLIKSTLSNLLPFPTNVANRIEKLHLDFLWGGLGEFKFHLVSWPKVCFPIYKRGLGVQNLLLFNCALLGK